MSSSSELPFVTRAPSSNRRADAATLEALGGCASRRREYGRAKMNVYLRLTIVGAALLPAVSSCDGSSAPAATADAATVLADTSPNMIVDAEDQPDTAPTGSEDWGFRPMVHGFAFENYTNEPMPTNLTIAEMQRLFGATVCEGTTAGDGCIPTPPARQWMERINTEMGGGHCEGMAVLSAKFFSGQMMPSTYGAPTTNALALMSNEALQREIALWFSTQFSLPSVERRNLTPSALVEDLAASFARGRAYGGTVLGMYKRAGGGGHAVTPYEIRRPTATTAEIVSYDNNYPNTERIVTVDLAANTWMYNAATNPSVPAELYDGDATTFNLTLADIQPRLALPHACAFCGNAPDDGGARGSVQVSLRGEGDLSIRDGMGNTTGASATGAPINTIPGATASGIRSSNLFRDSPEPLYTVPREQPLTITLDGSRLAAMSESELFIAAQGFTLGVESIELDPAQRDTIIVQPGMPDVSYASMGTETPTIVVSFQRPDEDYLIELRSSGVTAGQTTRLAVDFVQQRARIAFAGSTSATSFELYFERVTETGTQVFRHAGVDAMPSAVIFVYYDAWTGDGNGVRVEFDDDGDGDVDRNEMVSDQP